MLFIDFMYSDNPYGIVEAAIGAQDVAWEDEFNATIYCDDSKNRNEASIFESGSLQFHTLSQFKPLLDGKLCGFSVVSEASKGKNTGIERYAYENNQKSRMYEYYVVVQTNHLFLKIGCDKIDIENEDINSDGGSNQVLTIVNKNKQTLIFKNKKFFDTEGIELLTITEPMRVSVFCSTAKLVPFSSDLAH